MFKKYEDWTISNQAPVEIQVKAQRLSKAINVTIIYNRIRHIKKCTKRVEYISIEMEVADTLTIG